MKALARALSLPSLALAFSACATAGLYAHFVPYYFDGAGPSEECGQGPGFRYCVYRAPSGVREDPDAVLYFLHYAEGDERSWGRVPISRVYYAQFKKRGLPAPRVVSLSYGPYWTLFDEPGPRSPGRFAPFVGEAMPWLEAKLGRPSRRYVWGMSQGGLNAALLVLKRPELWAGAVFSCPALYAGPIFGAPAAIADYAARHRKSVKRVEWGMDLVRERVAGPAEWAREDPLVRAESARALPPVFVDCTTGDDFGFYEGAEKFVSILRGRGQAVSMHEGKGTHCELDARAAAGFLAGLQRPPVAAETGPRAVAR